jgi:hypothetical protein
MFPCFAEYAFYDKFRPGFVLPTVRVTVDQYGPKKNMRIILGLDD